MIKFTNSDEENESLQPLAFSLPPPKPNENLMLPPMDGYQYLHRVITEARKCAGVVIANIDKKPQRNDQIPKMPEIKTCNSDLLPTKDWQTSAMADFSKLRLRMDKLRQKIENDPKLLSKSPLDVSQPTSMNEEAWLKVVLQQEPEVLEKPLGPSTGLCLTMSQVTLWSLLGLLGDWLSDKDVSVPVCCRWVYCLLACLEHPIPPEVYFTLRHIARYLINYRAQLESREAEELPHINLIVCIIGRYFNQTDLADP